MKTDRKHAYLIVAHRDDLCFRTLLQMLDDGRNDIFIHMDAKCPDYDIEAVEKSARYSKVRHIQRSKISWGGSSLIWAELEPIE